jgi:hypothetical protein
LCKFPTGNHHKQRDSLNQRNLLNTIKGENAQLEQTNRQCLVTGLRIDMQKKTVFICLMLVCYGTIKITIKHFTITKQFFIFRKRKLKIIEQIYYIAHNIRNTLTNQYHNRKKFERRNYPDNQLRFDF